MAFLIFRFGEEHLNRSEYVFQLLGIRGAEKPAQHTRIIKSEKLWLFVFAIHHGMPTQMLQHLVLINSAQGKDTPVIPQTIA